MLNRTVSLYRDAYSGLSRSTWLLSLVMLVNRSGTMVLPFLTIYLTRPAMGYTIGQAGFIMGLFGLGAICGGFLGGRLSDRWGFYTIQLITLCGGGLLFIVLGQMKSLALIGIFTFLLSLVNEAFRPANSIAIAHYSKEENRTRSYSLNRLSINLGWAIGGAVGGFLASINYELLFWTDGITNLVAAVLLRYYLAPAGPEIHAPKKKAAGAAVSAYSDRPYGIFIVLTILFAMCFFQLFTTLPVYYKEWLHLDEFYIGLLMTLNGLIIAGVEMVIVFKLEGRRENLFYISNGIAVAGLSFILLVLLPASPVVAVFCMVLITFGEILSMPFMNSFWISRTSHNNRGQYAGLYTIAWSIAQVLGPTGGSQVAEHFSFNTLWWICGGICLVTAMGFKWLRQYR